MSDVNSGNDNSQYLTYGLDLGTTNSCIAIMEGDSTRIFQTKENINTTRSAVYVNKHGKRFVGLKAYNALMNDDKNVAIEFKRLMGTSDKKYFPSSGLYLSPSELSAEVLKSMRNDVQRLSNVNVKTAVITVPAAFGTLQCEATYQSAKEAGFEKVHLLQEPIAAAIAYGATPGSKSKNWMVYDFGGGTFDVAIVTTSNNRLTVLNNEGNNLLGGKDIDRLIVEKLLLPAIKEEYCIPDAHTDEFNKLFIKLLIIAEVTKNELSNIETTTVYIDSNDVGVDENGDDIDLEIEITRDDLELFMDGIIEETIDLAKKALEGSNIRNDILDNIVLVGGSTQIPMVRKKLNKHFGAKIVGAKDPITIVAKGAAIYASTTEVDVKLKQVNKYKTTPEGIELKLEYDKATAKSSTSVHGRLLSNVDIADLTIDSDCGLWTSGWFVLKDKENNYFEVDVRLQKDTVNSFTIRARDNQGNAIKIDNPNFNIRQKDDYIEVAKPLVTSSLCVEYKDTNGNNKLKPIIPKNTTLPAYEEYIFKANKELRSSLPNESLAIKLWEGEVYDEPEANIWVANLYIRAAEINSILPKGAEITVSISVDESRRVTIGATSTKFDVNIASDVFYKPTPLNIEDRFEKIQEDINEYYARLENIDSKIERVDEGKRKQYSDLYEEIEDFDMKYNENYDAMLQDKDSALKIIEEAKTKRKTLLSLEKDLLIEKSDYSIEKEAVESLNRLDCLLDVYGNDKDKDELSSLKHEVQEAIEFKDFRGVKHIARKINEREQYILSNKLDFWLYLFDYYCDEVTNYIDHDEANKWIEIGHNAARNDDLEALKEAIYKLSRLTEKDIEQVIKESIVDPGLNK